MDGNITEMLEGVLSDPAAMKDIMGMAEKLIGNEKEAHSDQRNEEEAETKSAASVSHGERKIKTDDRIALISALRPYLSPERRQTADNLIKMLKMLKLADINKLLK